MLKLLTKRNIFVGLIVIILLCSALLSRDILFSSNHNSLIPNKKLESVIRGQINKPFGILSPEDCLGVIELDLSLSDHNTNLEGIQYFADLEILKCSAGRISDISAVSGLKNLKELNLYKNQVNDLTPLSELTNLERLNLYDNNISDLAPLSSLTNLKYLVIGKNPVENSDDFFTPLAHLYGLQIVSYAEYEITVKP